MSSSFQIDVQRNKKAIRLKLSGDFDGSDACALVRLLKRYECSGLKIIVDSSGLSRIYPFGLQCFRKDCKVHNLSVLPNKNRP